MTHAISKAALCKAIAVLTGQSEAIVLTMISDDQADAMAASLANLVLPSNIFPATAMQADAVANPDLYTQAEAVAYAATLTVDQVFAHDAAAITKVATYFAANTSALLAKSDVTGALASAGWTHA
jgi:hypothetical protein